MTVLTKAFNVTAPKTQDIVRRVATLQNANTGGAANKDIDPTAVSYTFNITAGNTYNTWVTDYDQYGNASPASPPYNFQATDKTPPVQPDAPVDGGDAVEAPAGTQADA